MPKAQKQRAPRGYSALVLALVFLTNPTVNIFDYLPDFVGYFIIVRALRFFADRAPHFAEARDAFKKLAFVSLAKIPSYIIMIMARGQNAMDNDIKSLFTLTFTVVEVALIFDGIKNLFAALFYLGERGNATALISDFKLSKKGKTSSPEALRVLLFVFVIYKALATFLPELLLLSRSIDTGSHIKVFNPASLYPYVIIFAFVTVFILGIITASRTSKYIKSALAEGKLFECAEGLLTPDMKLSLEREIKVKGMKSILTLFIAASFLTVELCFDNFLGINLLPHFIFGIVMIIASTRLAKYSAGKKTVIGFGVLYVIASIATYVLEIDFVAKFGYSLLAESSAAKTAYRAVMISAGAEALLAIFFLVSSAYTVLSFALSHTGLSPDSEGYSRTDAEYRKQTRRKIYTWMGIGILVSLMKLLNTVQKSYAEIKLSSGNDEMLTTTYTLLPWFGAVLFIASVIYVAYSYHLFSRLKEDVEIKYS